MRIRIINDLTEYRPAKQDDTAQACKEWVEKYGELARTAIDEHFHDGSTFVRSPASESLQAILEKLKK